MSETSKISVPSTASASRGREGQHVGRWRLVALLGEGAHGTTWRAEGPDGRPAAVKLLDEPPGDELRALRSVCHPAVVQVLDAGAAPVPYVAMGLAAGLPLADIAAGGPRDENWTVRAAGALFQALAAVHRAGVVHGDIKTENALADPGDPASLVLVDFGFAGRTDAGTPAFAAPERLQGRGASAAGDVYSAGLCLWELLHGSLPHAELPLAEALVRRAEQAPEAAGATPWLARLLEQILAPDPRHRPSAAAVADTLTAHGAGSIEPTPELLLRRARSVHVPRPELADAADDWLCEGGALAIAGGPGVGRSHAIEELCTDLVADGRFLLTVPPSTVPWGGIELALRSPTLPGGPLDLPAIVDPDTRADAVAALLCDRAPADLVVVADDFDEIDDGTRRVLAALATSGIAAVLVGCSTIPDWADHRTTLRPLDEVGVRSLVDGILGSRGGLDAMYERAREQSGGRPSEVVALVVEAVRARALSWRSQDWIVDEAALARVEVPPDGRERLLVRDLSDEAREVGAWPALHGFPLPLHAVATLAGRPIEDLAGAVAELSDAGLVHIEQDRIRCTDSAVARALTPESGESRAEHHFRLAELLLGGRNPDLARIAGHLLGAEHPELAASSGAAVVQATLDRDAEAAAELAGALWRIAPTTELAQVRLRAYGALGWGAEAMAFVDELLGGREPEPADLPLLALAAHARARGGAEDPDYSDFLDRCEALCDRHGVEPPTELLLALCRRLNQRGEAAAVLERLAAAASFPPNDRQALDAWLMLRVQWAEALHADGRTEQGERLLAEIPDFLGRGLAARAAVDATRSRLLWVAGRIAEASEVLAGAVGPEAGLPPIDRARVSNNLGAVRYEAGDRAGAVRSWEEAQLLFDRLGAAVDRTRVLSNLCQGYTELGRWERARQAGEDAMAEAARLGRPELEAMAAGNLMSLHIACSAWDEAAAMHGRATAVAAEHDIRHELVELARRRAEMAVLRRAPEAVALAVTAKRAADEEELLLERCRCSAILAVALARINESTRAERAVQEAFEPLLEQGAAGVLAEARLWAAEAYLELGRTEDALALVEQVSVYATEVEHVRLCVRADVLEEQILERMPRDETGRDLAVVLDLATRLGRETDLRSVLNQVAVAARELLDVERAFVLTGDPPEVTALSVQDGSPGAQQPSWSVVRRTIAGGREIIAADLGERADLRDRSSIALQELRSVLSVPMIDGGVCRGVIYLDSRRHSSRKLRDASLLMRALASLAAVAVTRAIAHRDALERARRTAELAERTRSEAELSALARALAEKNGELEELNERLRASATTDPLTGAGNRRRFTEDIGALQDRALREGAGGFVVVLADLDRFKRINDQYGHLAGDSLLISVVRTLEGRLRTSDRLYRYGGEEFAILVEESDLQQGLGVAERLRLAVESAAGVAHDGIPLPPVTMSFGVARFDATAGEDWSRVVDRADQALYQAKEAGRNRVKAWHRPALAAISGGKS